jgi:amidase
MARHRLSRDQVIRSFGPDLQPVLDVEPGDVVTFETNDCFTGQIRTEHDLVTSIDMTRPHLPPRPSDGRPVRHGRHARRDGRRRDLLHGRRDRR